VSNTKHGDRKGSPLLYYERGVYSSGDPCGHHAYRKNVTAIFLFTTTSQQDDRAILQQCHSRSPHFHEKKDDAI